MRTKGGVRFYTMAWPGARPRGVFARVRVASEAGALPDEVATSPGPGHNCATTLSLTADRLSAMDGSACDVQASRYRTEDRDAERELSGRVAPKRRLVAREI